MGRDVGLESQSKFSFSCVPLCLLVLSYGPLEFPASTSPTEKASHCCGNFVVVVLRVSLYSSSILLMASSNSLSITTLLHSNLLLLTGCGPEKKCHKQMHSNSMNNWSEGMQVSLMSQVSDTWTFSHEGLLLLLFKFSEVF